VGGRVSGQAITLWCQPLVQNSLSFSLNIMDKKYLRKIEKLGLTWDQVHYAFFDGVKTMVKIRGKMGSDSWKLGHDRYSIADLECLIPESHRVFKDRSVFIFDAKYKYCVTKKDSKGIMHIHLDFPYRDKFNAGEASYLIHEIGHYITKDRSKKTKYEREFEAIRLQHRFDNQVKDKDSRSYLYSLDFGEYVLGFYEFYTKELGLEPVAVTTFVNAFFQFAYKDIGQIYKDETPLEFGWYTVYGVCLAKLLK